MSNSFQTKKKLFTLCKDFVEDSITTLQLAMNESQEAANADQKGSAGDKHETGRAMMHLEKEKNAKQLSERLKLREVVSMLNPQKEHNRAQLGSLVKTNNAIYYLSIPMGRVKIEDEEYLVISPVSPIGQLVLNTIEGDVFSFNGTKNRVEEVL